MSKQKQVSANSSQSTVANAKGPKDDWDFEHLTRDDFSHDGKGLTITFDRPPRMGTPEKLIEGIDFEIIKTCGFTHRKSSHDPPDAVKNKWKRTFHHYRRVASSLNIDGLEKLPLVACVTHDEADCEQLCYVLRDTVSNSLRQGKEAITAKGPREESSSNFHSEMGANQHKRKTRANRKVAEDLVIKHLIRRPHDTGKEVAHALGCGKGTVIESPGWKANQARLRDAKQKKKDPIALPLEDYMNSVGQRPDAQIRKHKQQQDSQDNEIDRREQEFDKRIYEYDHNHPNAKFQEIAKALDCTAGEVERRQASLSKLVVAQKKDERETHQSNKPLWDSKP